MSRRVSRRVALKHLAAAGAGVFAPVVLRAQDSPIVVAGRRVEILIASVSPTTVRITVAPVDGSIPQTLRDDGALVGAAGRSDVSAPRSPP